MSGKALLRKFCVPITVCLALWIGHWYARAMASFALIQGWTGVRYDAVDQTLHFDPAITETVPLFTATGFGLVHVQNGQARLETRFGSIPVRAYCPLGTKGSPSRLR